MNDVPFGFSDDAHRKGGSGGDGSNPFGPGAGGFDPAQLGQMLSQLGQMLSSFGSSMSTGGSNPSAGPVNYDLARSLAHQQSNKSPAVRGPSSQAVADAARLAELWLDGATTLPAGATRTLAWSPNEWVDGTMETWQRLVDPVARQISNMWTTMLPPEAAQLAGPVMGMLGQMGGMAFGTQLGQALGHLSTGVLTSTEIGLPLAPNGTAALLPTAIARFSADLDQPDQEILVFLAAREAAHLRLFQHVPWLRQRVLGAVEEFARGIKVDMSGIEQAAAQLDLSMLSDPAKLEELISANGFAPQTTPEQKQALERLETIIALIEGWVETTVSAALGDRLPSTAALTETMRRRRASGGPAEQTFATLVGLEIRPRKMREAAVLWRTATEQVGIDIRDGIWAHPDLLPEAADLDAPEAFLARLAGPADTDLEDALARLEREANGESE